jgi:nitroreductase
MMAQNRQKGTEALNMTDFMTILKERRSVRKYEDKEIPQEILNQILEAVRWSPSWANTQCWEVVVIKDSAVKTKLQETLAPKNPATKAIVNAPVLLALCGKRNSSGYYGGQVTTKFGDWFMFDLGIATQSLCLAAHHFGLGTVVVGLIDHDRAKTVLNVPAEYELVALIPLGYPAKISSAPGRRKIQEFTHLNAF